MKKLLTLALALSVAIGGFAQMQKASSKNDALRQASPQIGITGDETFQHVGNTPSVARTDTELEYTFYDWETNTAYRNQTMSFPDGCVGFSYVHSDNINHTNRGTDIVIYNPETDEWTTSGGPVESHMTFFGSTARYGENGIVLVARNPNSTTCEVFIIEDKDNLPHRSLEPIYALPGNANDHNPHFPTVMCTGPDHNHIHILVTAYGEETEEGQINPFYYFRSMDGGETWDDYMTIPQLGREFSPGFGMGQDAHFMENTGGNQLNIVVNTRRGNGIVLTSNDEGDTWETTEYYHHPGIETYFPEESVGFMYPRWTSALWDNEGVLHLIYEFGGAYGDAYNTDYFSGIGGITYWNDEMPYYGDSEPLYGPDPTNPKPPVAGQPFIADSAYLYEDIYMSLWFWNDATHDMWPEYIGYITPLDENEQPLENPYDFTEFFMYDAGLRMHGRYNSGVCAMPVLLMTPDQEMMVAVWMGLDDHHAGGFGEFNELTLSKLFARASFDKGQTWTPMKHLTSDFMFGLSEFVFPQAAIAGNKLVIAVQTDGQPDSYVIPFGGVNQGDTNPDDNYYQALTFDLEELFGYDGVEEQEVVSHNTSMNLYPNPATDQLNITLNQNAEIAIYNIVGQKVMSTEGHAGANNINISTLTSGVYFVNAGSATQKFVVK